MGYIALEKLNEVLVNVKANAAVKDFNASAAPNDVIDMDTVDKKVHLAKIVLRAPAVKNQAGVPFYAFIKRAGDKMALVDVISGSAQLVCPSIIASESDVKGKFRINGITYGLKDTVNGYKRYRPLSCEPRKHPAKKIALNGPEISEALAEEEAIAEDEVLAEEEALDQKLRTSEHWVY